MAEEATAEPAVIEPPPYAILKRRPAEALSLLAEYVDGLKRLPPSEEISEKLVLANAMAAEIARHHAINLDFELKPYILKAGKKIQITRRERVVHNFGAAAEAILRLRARQILRNAVEEDWLRLSRTTAEEIRERLDLLNRELRPPSDPKRPKDPADRRDIGADVRQWLRSSYEVILATAAETDASEAAPAETSPRALEALEEIETLIFGGDAPAAPAASSAKRR